MAQAAADPAAQVQPDAAGPGVPAAVEAREPPVEDPGQVLRCDAHAGVPDAQVIAVHGDGHGAACGVFQGVGQHPTGFSQNAGVHCSCCFICNNCSVPVRRICAESL